MKAIIEVSAKEALMTGNNQTGPIVVEFEPADLTTEQAGKLGEIYNYHEKAFMANPHGNPKAARADKETLKELLDQRLLADKKAAAEEKAREEKARIDKLIASAEYEQKKRDEARQKEAATQARQHQIARWVEKHGTPNQKARWREGLLPEDEVLDAIREDAFRDLEVPRYRRLRASDVCDEVPEPYDYHRREFSVERAKALSASQYEQLRRVREAAEQAHEPAAVSVEPRVHIGECQTCDQEVKRVGFLVKITVGEFEFSREYGMNEE